MSNALKPDSTSRQDTAESRRPAARAINGTRTRGFTLVELMIVVAVVAIITAIAFPQYQSQVRKSRRTAAKTALLDVASREEKYYATQNTYTGLANLAYASSVVQVPSASQDYYNVTVTVGTPTNGYTATATPQGDQTKDGCGSYSLTNLGVQSVTGTASSCW